MIDKEEWTEVKADPDKEEDKVEFEVEEEVKTEAPSDTEPKEKVEVKEEKPEELDGIETKGAQKSDRDARDSKSAR